MRTLRISGAIAAVLLAVAACGDKDLTAPTVGEVAGTYTATTFTATSGATTTDYLNQGGSITVTLASNATTSGSMVIPTTALGAGATYDLAGTWRLTATTVQFTGTGAHPMEDLTWIFEDDELLGYGTLNGNTIAVTMRK